MGKHHDHDHDHCRECGWSKHEVNELIRICRGILHTLNHPQLTRFVKVIFTGANMENNALVFNVGQVSQASILPLLADGSTPSGGSLSNVVYTFDDPSATVVANQDGITATCTGVAASNGPVSGSVSCTVTDSDGAVSQWTQAFTITTNGGAPPDQLTQSVVVQFSDPGAGSGAGGPGNAGQPKVAALKKPLNE